MPKITFIPSLKTIEISLEMSLYDAAHLVGLPVASSCSAEFVCGKCDMKILKGKENLSPQTEEEKKMLIREGKSPENRLSCQALVKGDCMVTTSYW